MISQCANPECGAEFRFLREGKVLRFEFPYVPKRSAPRTEFFWLCGDCAPKWRMHVGRDGSLIITTSDGVPLTIRRPQRVAGGDLEELGTA